MVAEFQAKTVHFVLSGLIFEHEHNGRSKLA